MNVKKTTNPLIRSTTFCIVLSCAALGGAPPSSAPLTSFLVSYIGEKTMTMNNLDDAMDQIQAFAAEHNHPPAKLSDLPRLDTSGYTDEKGAIIDGWGKPIIYTLQKDGSVLLRSVGDGENARSIRFSIVNWGDAKERDALNDTFGDMRNIELVVGDFVAAHQRMPTK